MAFEVLEGFGDAGRGQWEDSRERAFHLRRRLSEKEQKHIGGMADLRGTQEAQQRLEIAKRWLPTQMLSFAENEIRP